MHLSKYQAGGGKTLLTLILNLAVYLFSFSLPLTPPEPESTL